MKKKLSMLSRGISTQTGFTLIELLVVISIIGMLASVTLVALNGARLKGKAGAVQQEVLQLRLWMEQQRSASGSYAPAFTVLSGATLTTSVPNVLFYTFGNTGNPCSAVSDQQFQSLCNAIVNNNGGVSNSLIIGGPTGVGGINDPIWTTHNLYSITAQLPNNQLFLCVGSSGNSSNNVSSSNFNSNAGCVYAP